jgi:hypothetical protein
MILSNILYRTFFIKAEQYGTAFTIHVDGIEYLITARHLLKQAVQNFELKLFFQNVWHGLPTTVVGHGKDEVDISVLRVPNPLSSAHLEVIPSMGELVFGQDIFFLGFPYKMWNDVGELMGGLPCAFAKKGTVSSLGFGDPQVLYIDAINNEGFSGGPLFFSPIGRPNEVRIAGVVSKFRTEHETVLDAEGNLTEMSVPFNTGFLVAYGIKHVFDIIQKKSIVQ